MGKPIIIAGGGIVTNELGELLMIFRRGKWDLPKGKLDEGESIEDCAIREVEEETGVKNLKLGAKLLVTEHEYFDK
jgi:8-oxo-dGTP pyrophosphatase MutT (NUDIX family)